MDDDATATFRTALPFSERGQQPSTTDTENVKDTQRRPPPPGIDHEIRVWAAIFANSPRLSSHPPPPRPPLSYIGRSTGGLGPPV